MAKARTLSQGKVSALTCPTGKDRVFLWDSAVRGFGVVAHRSGKKTYILQYRQGGRSRRLALGEHGRVTFKQAETLAQKATGAIADGKDPIEARQLERGGPDFNELADAYMRLHVKPKIKDSTAREYERLLRLHLRPKLGTKKAKAITPSIMAGLHAGMEDTPGAANRSLSLFSSIWNWSVRSKKLPDLPNPAADVENYPEEGKERFLTPDEAQRLGAAMRQAGTVGISWAEPKSPSKHRPKTQSPTVFDPHAVAAILLLLMTGARLREILHSKWSDFDRHRGILFLSDSKTGKKPVYISSVALRILDTIPQTSSDPYIIVGMKEHRNKKGERIYKPRADLKRPWAAIRRAAGLEGFRIHDLRHSFASTGVGSSLGLPIIGALLGHARPETTQRYAHLAAHPVRQAAETITAELAAAIEAKVGQ